MLLKKYSPVYFTEINRSLCDFHVSHKKVKTAMGFLYTVSEKKTSDPRTSRNKKMERIGLKYFSLFTKSYIHIKDVFTNLHAKFWAIRLKK